KRFKTSNHTSDATDFRSGHYKKLEDERELAAYYKEIAEVRKINEDNERQERELMRYHGDTEGASTKRGKTRSIGRKKMNGDAAVKIQRVHLKVAPETHGIGSDADDDMDVEPAPVARRSQVRKAKQQLPSNDVEHIVPVASAASGIRRSHIPKVNKLLPVSDDDRDEIIDTRESVPKSQVGKGKRARQRSVSEDDIDVEPITISTKRTKSNTGRAKQKATQQSPLSDDEGRMDDVQPTPVASKMTKGNAEKVKQKPKPQSPPPASDFPPADPFRSDSPPPLPHHSLSPELLPPSLTYRPIPLPAVRPVRPQPQSRLATGPGLHTHDIKWKKSPASLSPTLPPIEDIMDFMGSQGKASQDLENQVLGQDTRRRHKPEPVEEAEEQNEGTDNQASALPRPADESSDDERIKATTPHRIQLMTYPWYTKYGDWARVDGARLSIMPADLRSMMRGSLQDWKCLKLRKHFTKHGQFVNLGKADHGIFDLTQSTGPSTSSYLIFKETGELAICVIVGASEGEPLQDNLVHKSIILVPVADQIDSALGNIHLVLEDEMVGSGANLQGPSLDGAGLVFSTTFRKRASPATVPVVVKKPKPTPAKKKVQSRYITNRGGSSSSDSFRSEYPNVKGCDADVPIYEGRASKGHAFSFSEADFEGLATRQRYAQPELEDNTLVAVGYSVNIFGNRSHFNAFCDPPLLVPAHGYFFASLAYFDTLLYRFFLNSILLFVGVPCPFLRYVVTL
ncbi:hypothetical protein BDN72DRAFT_864882, partial [Pluteus cervinus]